MIPVEAAIFVSIKPVVVTEVTAMLVIKPIL